VPWWGEDLNCWPIDAGAGARNGAVLELSLYDGSPDTSGAMQAYSENTSHPDMSGKR
jgi:hypothetical protein